MSLVDTGGLHCRNHSSLNEVSTSPHIEAVRAALRQSAYSSLRELECHDRDGIITLRGRVPSYFLKQLAQETATQMAGDAPIVNRIEVVVRDEFEEADADATHDETLSMPTIPSSWLRRAK